MASDFRRARGAFSCGHRSKRDTRFTGLVIFFLAAAAQAKKQEDDSFRAEAHNMVDATQVFRIKD